MKRAKVRIVGIAPLLMNRFAIETMDDDTNAKRKDQKYDPQTDAERAAYKDEKIGYYIPSSHVEGALKKAGSDFKSKGMKTYKDVVQASVFVEEEMLPLNRNEWDEIDRRAAKVQTARIVRARPRFNKWALSFTLSFDDERITPDVLKQILSEAGATRGVGDYRPKFGRFKVAEFDVVESDSEDE